MITDIVKKVNNAHEKNIIFYCDAGQHRSVFLANILERVFENS